MIRNRTRSTSSGRRRKQRIGEMGGGEGRSEKESESRGEVYEKRVEKRKGK